MAVMSLTLAMTMFTIFHNWDWNWNFSSYRI